MKQAALCALTCLILGGAGTAGAGSAFSTIPPDAGTPVRHWDGSLNHVDFVSPHLVKSDVGPVKIRGKRQRARLRWVRWLDGLKADRLTAFESNGVPDSRYFENFGGRVRELWSYPKLHVQLVFKDNTLTARRTL